MMANARKSQHGDTIIEVLLAMSLLTFILFTSWGLVNRSTQASLASRKRIEMVNQLKEQAEILKTKYYTKDGKLADLITQINLEVGTPIISTGAKYDTEFCSLAGSTDGSSAGFHFNPTEAKAQPKGKNVNQDGSSFVWIEQVTGTNYADFYIRGCWLTIGGQQKTDNSQFIVRLNS